MRDISGTTIMIFGFALLMFYTALVRLDEAPSIMVATIAGCIAIWCGIRTYREDKEDAKKWKS